MPHQVTPQQCCSEWTPSGLQKQRDVTQMGGESDREHVRDPTLVAATHAPARDTGLAERLPVSRTDKPRSAMETMA
jgi:hypothetical protein